MRSDEEGLVKMSYTGNVVMELTPYMEERLRDAFDLELDMLRGTKTPLPDGRTRFEFVITSEEKGRMLVDFIRMLPMARTTWLN